MCCTVRKFTGVAWLVHLCLPGRPFVVQEARLFAAVNAL